VERDEHELLERVRPLQAEARERLAAPPSPEEILAYHEGRLDPAARLAVEEGIAAFPESGRLLRDLARFPEVEPDAGVAVPSDDEIDARWRQFQAARRRPAGSAAGGRAAVAPAEDPPAPRLAPITPLPIRREPSRIDAPRRRRWPVALALAATLLLGLGLGYLLAPRETRPAGRVNLALAALAPQSEMTSRGAEATDLEVPAAADGVLLSIGYGGSARPLYTLSVHDPRGRRILHRGDLAPDDSGTFLVELPRELLTPGRYRLELTASGEAEPLAVYDLDLIFR
jgi:hypothetical protein